MEVDKIYRDAEFDPDSAVVFDNCDQDQITVGEFFRFLLNKIADEDIDLDTKLYVAGSNRFYIHSDKKNRKLFIDNIPIRKKYPEGLEFKKWERK